MIRVQHIVIPPALANIYRALIGQVILAVLFTSVVSQIAAEDLTYAGDYLNSRTFRSFEIYCADFGNLCVSWWEYFHFIR